MFLQLLAHRVSQFFQASGQAAVTPLPAAPRCLAGGLVRVLSLLLLFGAVNPLLAASRKPQALYVAVAGRDSNAGTKAQPLATLAAAQRRVRRLAGPVTVYLRGGTYYLPAPLVFTRADSRPDHAGVTYQPYPGERVTVSGAVPLQLSWKPYQGSIRQAAVPGTGVVFDQLFVGGQQQRQARYPNFNPQEWHYGGYAADALSPARVATWHDPAGGYVHSLHQAEWGDFSYELTGKDAQGALTMVGGYQNNRPSPLHPTIRFVENIREELDQPGEFFYDKKLHTLLFIPPPGLDLAHALVESPRLESLFEFRGSPQAPVRNITLTGLRLAHTLRTFMQNKEPLLRSDWTIYRVGAVTLAGAENCAVRHCFFDRVGGNAVVVSNYNRRDEITGCRIDRAGSSGIVLVGDPAAVRSPLFRYEQAHDPARLDRTPGPLTRNYPAECRVYDNLIESIGQVEKQVAGVQLSMCAAITVSHNTIDDVPRAGINVNEGTWGGHVIEYNDVFNTVLETGDHGAFNSWGRDRYWHPDRAKMNQLVAAEPGLVFLDVVQPIILRYNRFHCEHGWDIDLDDGSSNYEIYNNVLLNGGLKLREGFRRLVSNNVLLNNSFHPHVWFQNSGDVFTHNIVAASYFPIGINDWGTGIDYNLFPDSVALAKARRNGTDAHSRFGNPQYVNPAAGNYQVQPQSPALAIGFQNFDLRTVGVVSAGLKKLAHPTPLPRTVLAPDQAPDAPAEFLGATVKNLTTLGERSATGMDRARGVLVVAVPAGSVLHGQLEPQDVLLQFNGRDISSLADLAQEKMALQLHSSVPVSVFRNQQLKTFSLRVR